jgi:DNA-binding transcriptional LysR family regulator
MPAILERLQGLAPGVRVDLLASNTVRDLQRREADIALRHVRPEQPDLVARRLPDFGVTLYASTAWLDRHGRPRSGEDLRASPLIGYVRPGTMFADLAARGVPMTERNVRVATDSMVVVWEMVKQGLGIGLAMREIAALTPGVEPVLPEVPPIPVPIWIVTHRELHTSRRIRLVFDLLADAFSTLAR